VPVPGGKDGELTDEWLEFYHKPENEEEFPLRNNQVTRNRNNKGHELLYLRLQKNPVDSY
jgi:hypothetical protein